MSVAASDPQGKLTFDVIAPGNATTQPFDYVLDIRLLPGQDRFACTLELGSSGSIPLQDGTPYDFENEVRVTTMGCAVEGVPAIGNDGALIGAAILLMAFGILLYRRSAPRSRSEPAPLVGRP